MSTVSRGNLGESKVKKELQKVKEHYKLINNFTYVNPKTNTSHQIDHIFIHPHGVFVIETKNYYGTIISETGEAFWLKIIKNERQIISNPVNQNKTHTSIINRLLEKKYEVISVIVFVRNNAPYVGDYNVINLKDLLLLIKTHPYKRLLSDEEVDGIYKTLKKLNSKVSAKEHKESVNRMKKEKQFLYEEKAFAIENRICPRCNVKMMVTGNHYKCPNCHFSFDIS